MDPCVSVYSKQPSQTHPHVNGNDTRLVGSQDEEGFHAPLTCDPTRPAPVDPSVYFDHSRFTAFLQFQNQREKQLRWVYRRQGKTPKWLSLDFYTDEILHEELTSIYGEQDKCDPMYKKIFVNYKEDRLEGILEWIQEEKEMIQELLAARVPLVDPSYETPSEDVIQPLSIFTEEELEAFHQVHLGPIEHFHLPRSVVVKNPSPLTQLQSLLRPYVTGILPEVLFRKFTADSLRKKIARGDQASELKFITMCLQASLRPWSQEVPPPAKSPFLYPSDSNGLLSTPRDLFRNILHKFQVLLLLSNGVLLPTREACSKFYDLLKFSSVLLPPLCVLD